MEHPETIKVVNPETGFMIINKSDFDEKVHKLFEVKPAGDGGGEAKVTATTLRSALDEKGIKYPSNASKADLQALLDGTKA